MNACRAMPKKRKAEANGLDEMDRQLYGTFRTAANSISALYTSSLSLQKRAFNAGARHATERLLAWALGHGEGQLSAADLAAALQAELVVLEGEDAALQAAADGVGGGVDHPGLAAQQQLWKQQYGGEYPEEPQLSDPTLEVELQRIMGSLEEEEVRAACLVDADVEVEFLPSKASEARESREAAEAAAAIRAVEEAEAAAAVAAAQAAAAAAPTAEDVRAARLRRFQ